jgi:hypothetical protein
MKKEFLPYDLEVKLVELGFNEKTFDVHSDIITSGFKIVKKPTPRILYQQAFRFFREKYRYWVYVREASKGKCRFYIEKFDEKYFTSEIFNTYEEAELECLVKLIEITKEQNVK